MRLTEQQARAGGQYHPNLPEKWVNPFSSTLKNSSSPHDLQNRKQISLGTSALRRRFIEMPLSWPERNKRI